MMQHIASREALVATNQHLLDVPSRSSGVGLAALGSDLDGVSDLLLAQVALRRTLSEDTLSPDARSGIVQQLLGRQDQRRRRWTWCSSPSGRTGPSSRDLQDALRRLSRTAMFRRAERTGELDEVEDQLFRFGRIVDAIARAVGDPGRPDRRPGRLVRRWSTSCCPDVPTRWSPSWSTRWPGTPAGGRSPTACASCSIRRPQRRDKIVAFVKTAATADR